MAQQLPNGRWRARVRLNGQLTSLGTFDLKRDAQRAEREAKVATDQGNFIDLRGSLTVYEFACSYVDSRIYRETSERRVKTYLNDLHYSPIGRKPIARVEEYDVQRWVKGLSLHLAPSTLRNHFIFLRSVFDAAIRSRKAAHNPCNKNIQLPKKEKRKIRPLTMQQVFLLAERVPERNRSMVLVQAGCGLRIGELLALQVEHVDFLHREVHIEQQLAPGARSFSKPKTPSSVRTVPLPEWVATALAGHLETFPPSAEGTIFSTRFGRAYRHDYYGSRIFKKGVKDSDLPVRTTPHALRHYFASELVSRGLSVYLVAELLGHETPALVLSIYGHLMPGSEDVARKTLEAAYQDFCAISVPQLDKAAGQTAIPTR